MRRLFYVGALTVVLVGLAAGYGAVEGPMGEPATSPTPPVAVDATPTVEAPPDAPSVETASPSTASVDASTSATDVTTGASQVVNVKVAGHLSVQYTTLENGTLSITVEELARAYALDELASDTLFKGKRMRVWGTVARLAPAGSRTPWVVFTPTPEDKEKAPPGKDVRCALARPLPATVKKGDKITIEGTGAGMTFTVNLSDGFFAP